MAKKDSLFHEYCLLFPQATDAELADMAEDIKKYGLNEPIIRYKGQILDGRNRYLACKMAEVEPTFKDYTGEEPLTFVVSKNLMRRNLTPSQRALAGYKAYKALVESENLDPKTAKKLIAGRFAVTDAALDSVDRVEEFAIPEVRKQMHELAMSVGAASKIVTEAAANAGINIDRKATWESLSPQQQARILQAQTDILEEPRNFELDDGLTLDAHYSLGDFRKTIHDIEGIIAKMSTLPTLYSEAKDLMGSLEEEKLMVIVGNMMISEANKVLGKLYDESLSYDDVLGLAASMLNMRFKVPDLSNLREAERVDELQEKIKDGCESLIKSVRKIKRALSADGESKGERAFESLEKGKQ